MKVKNQSIFFLLKSKPLKSVISTEKLFIKKMDVLVVFVEILNSSNVDTDNEAGTNVDINIGIKYQRRQKLKNPRRIGQPAGIAPNLATSITSNV